jgi:hypothetical protein
VLGEALEREGRWARERAQRVGVEAGGDALVWGRFANANPPVLRTHAANARGDLRARQHHRLDL